MNENEINRLEANAATKVCRFCAETIRAEAVKCRYCGSIVESRALGGLAHPWLRPREGRKIAGVCMGLADQFGISVTLIRLAFILGFLFSIGIPFVLVYVVLWLVMPDEDDAPGPRDGARYDYGPD
jgi:phage shock protein PspC (stress-responsive transcriptional regulator)/ribosomal protein L40E